MKLKKTGLAVAVIAVAGMLTGCARESQMTRCLGYQPDDVVFVINADDVGMHPDMDRAVVDLYEQGVIQTFSLMVPAPNFAFSANYARQRNLPVGLHLTLTNEWQEANGWGPVLSRKEVPSLYNEAGYMWPDGPTLAEHADIRDVVRELEAQITRALAMGLNVTHLDFHMLYWDARDDFLTETLNLADKYQLPVITQLFWKSQTEQMEATASLREDKLYGPDVFWMYYNPEPREKDPSLSQVLYRDMFDQAKPALHHVAIHPAYLTDSAEKKMLDARFRADEMQVWHTGKLQTAIARNQIQFTNYQKLRDILSGKEKCVVSEG
ncbi:polysaccharide deacetylase family protein [Photobacterium sp. CCB-ST2H9]|uniref:polysaccharide deacetylase family protein n=1 Tax=unclassified Photobacterium TaxID=2628852 RepID=UPI0020046690|nr:polysaccharide deacetylase family protein [Photobacterium sp. CCB-ST2H9]UTM59394.1 polysaccharide deacetylase family protein [Photobacterium sp. CCB-ST2H9]